MQLIIFWMNYEKGGFYNWRNRAGWLIFGRILIGKGYEVHGLKRRASSFNTSRIDHIYQDLQSESPQFFLHYGDLTDSSNLIRLVLILGISDKKNKEWLRL